MIQVFKQSEATAARRRIFLCLVDATDGITPETAQTGTGFISKNGAAPVATTNSLVEISSTNMPGRYYIELTAAELDTLGIVEVRYKSAATAEAVARGQVVAYDPFSATSLGLSNLDAAISSRAAPGDAMTLSANALTAAALAADAVDEIWAKAITEPAQGIPPATPDAITLLAWFWMAFRNQEQMTASEYRITNDAGTVLAKATVSDDGTTVTKAKMVSGP